MQTTRLFPMHVNKGKTVAASIKGRTDYAKNPNKTDGGELVSTYECDPATVGKEKRGSVYALPLLASIVVTLILSNDRDSKREDFLSHLLRLQYCPGLYRFRLPFA
ncbi:MAG: hypothetical protein RSF90_07450, partial [Pygmaiobacter sp.]